MRTPTTLLASLALLAVTAGGCTHDLSLFVEGLPDTQMVVAHRGGAQIGPENTAAAFDLAVADLIHADILELDIHVAGDGEFVVIHDRTVDRVTGEGDGCDTAQDTEEETFGSVRVDELDVDALQVFDAGHCWRDPQAADDAPDDELYPFRGTGVQIPRLDDVLGYYSEQRILIEIKEVPEDRVPDLIGLVVDRDALDRTCFLDFDEHSAAAVSEALPEGGCVTMSAEGTRCWAADAILPFGGGTCEDYDVGWFPEENSGFNLKKQRLVDNLHATGAPVFYWTINEEPMMEEILDLGADGLVTDRPDVLRDLLQLRD